jgi:hypothetical protein
MDARFQLRYPKEKQKLLLRMGNLIPNNCDMATIFKISTIKTHSSGTSVQIQMVYIKKRDS